MSTVPGIVSTCQARLGVAGAGRRLWLWTAPPGGLPPQFTAPVQPTWRDGKDHAGHEGDCFGVGQALVEAQGAPGPERDRVADGRAQPLRLLTFAGPYRQPAGVSMILATV
jgi:hypothetical protein